MDGEIIALGDELTSGQRLDTNSQWISQRLGELGVHVLYHSTAADDLAACNAVFRHAIERADVVVATGGLGPTADDLTREAIAAATGTPLELDEQALEAIRSMFTRRGRSMPESNQKQAMFPRGSRPIANPHGTAPGIAMQITRPGRPPCHLFALPGVPAELFEMWQQSVGPAIAQIRGPGRVIVHRRIKCFGTGESHLEAMLPDMIRRGRNPQVGITVHEATITLRVTAQGASQTECDAAMQPTLETIRQRLGNLVFGEEDDELEHAVAHLLAERKATLVTAEWGTAGLIAQWLAHAPQAAGVYLGGLAMTSCDAWCHALGISSSAVEEHGPISAEMATAMASGARDLLGADYALAVSQTPIPPEPAFAAGSSDSLASSPPVFYVALATPSGVVVHNFPHAAHPAILKPLAAKRAMNVLRLALL